MMTLEGRWRNFRFVSVNRKARGPAVMPGFPLSEMNGTSLIDGRISRIGQLYQFSIAWTLCHFVRIVAMLKLLLGGGECFLLSVLSFFIFATYLHKTL